MNLRKDTEVRKANSLKVGDVFFGSRTVPDYGAGWTEGGHSMKIVCGWYKVAEVKHHTDTSVTLLSHILVPPHWDTYDRDEVAWVEYPRKAPVVCLRRKFHK